jgi:hypothetical protein
MLNELHRDAVEAWGLEELRVFHSLEDLGGGDGVVEGSGRGKEVRGRGGVRGGEGRGRRGRGGEEERGGEGGGGGGGGGAA